ncbi:RNA polymerase I, putative [Plasmodium knowlesi strain H]|uniref:DNA-directed RNA polymerase subunit n=3 Tax=Plasmodium knowlesi TaxID=5850 RepID=A0A5K1VB45_PLAKH|nr:RNA polymerase I, putative [Plasmodium knowlesi strain H]OTN67071.1 DNA-directed RNA polymerase subunit [Plasmodium knowlesi]CAA9988746.1 RNA polymerase I, putative [Plasmodium knowlesi strain H]SBO21696.1 RNA polymerase I, putative [Plasmodium knowlesi strain H]SBO22071.1 RNA polymerase I, putative [Plasmodium knowlesi strain H]VVS78220.1 RNA polymerase I, putative [Plasmodium knowlesi strain H]|eukprot:XP_002259722.1 RNA polymerase I, putative [Plasmodium knowlesi strain H]
MYDINKVVSVEVRSAELDVLNSEELRKISLGKYENELLEYEKTNSSGMTSKIYFDPKYGTIDYRQICSVCFEKHENCVGHIGHLEFTLPLFNPLFYKDVYDLLGLVCLNCYHVCCSEDTIFLLKHIYQLRALNEIESSSGISCKTNYDRQYVVGKIEELYRKICEQEGLISGKEFEGTNYANQADGQDYINLSDAPNTKDEDEKTHQKDDVQLNVKKIKEKIKKFNFDASKLAFESNYNYEEYLKLIKTLKVLMKRNGRCPICKFKRNISARMSQKRDTINFVGMYLQNSFLKKYMKEEKKRGKGEDPSVGGEEELEEMVEREEEGENIYGSRNEMMNAPDDIGISPSVQVGQAYDASEASPSLADGGGTPTRDNFPGTTFNYRKQNVKEKTTVRLFSFQVIDLLGKIFKKNDKDIMNLLYPFTKRDGHKVFFLHDMGISANRFRVKLRGIHKKSKMLNVLNKFNALLNLCIRAKKEIDFEELMEKNKKDLQLYKEMFSLFSIRMKYKFNVEIMDDDTEITKVDFLKGYDLIYRNKSAYINVLFSNLQVAMNTFFDNSFSAYLSNAKMSNQGLKEILDKKEGILRKNIMGKRVNNCARTVISPDTFIETNQIGVPLEFAKKLTMDECITESNLDYVKRLILNGPDVYPGALSYRDARGNVFKLPSEYEKREHIVRLLEKMDLKKQCATMVLHRHARDGDIVIMNRQPTLHKFSIMAHYIKIFQKEKVFRLNYVNCSSYNADFDGDEMNLHLLQTPHARSEASHLMNSDFLFTSFKDGSPLRGLAQDFILGGLHLTSLETFLDYDEYCNLLQCALNCLLSRKDCFFFEKSRSSNSTWKIRNHSYLDPYAVVLNRTHFTIVTEEPTILFPRKLWTGKQLITSILKTIIDKVAMETYNQRKDNEFMQNYKGINYYAKAKTDPSLWSFDPINECEVIIKNSELLQGVLDKLHFGASSNSFVHLCYELFGPKIAAVILDCFGRLFISFLQLRGTSLSLFDFILKKDAREEKINIRKRISFTGFYLQNLFTHSIAKALNADVNEMSAYSRGKLNSYRQNNDLFANNLYELYKRRSDFINDFVGGEFGEKILLTGKGKKENVMSRETHQREEEEKKLSSSVEKLNSSVEKLPSSEEKIPPSEEQLDIKEEAYFSALLHKEIQNLLAAHPGEGTPNSSPSSLVECALERMASTHPNGGNDASSDQEDEGDNAIKYAKGVKEEVPQNMRSALVKKLFRSLSEPHFMDSPNFIGDKATRVIEKVVRFLKKANCSRRLKVYILFELFQNKSVMKHFPALASCVNDLSHNVSNEEILHHVLSSVSADRAQVQPDQSDQPKQMENGVVAQEMVSKFLRLLQDMENGRGFEENSEEDQEEREGYDGEGYDGEGYDGERYDGERYESSPPCMNQHDEEMIRDSLKKSFPSFLLNEEIGNLSFNGKDHYYESYVNQKGTEEDTIFQFYNMKDIFNKLEFLIHTYFLQMRGDFDGLIDSLFQPYLCRVSSNTNNLISMENIMNKFLNNGFSNMIFTGAKGSKVNYAMICGMLDQQYLDGKRVPRMRSGKTLPSFHRYDYGARACGLITDCFLEGLRPQEYFFHCMSGREGLIDTAVKTAKSGYIQRCLVKCMESVILHYDGTVRNEDNAIIQFLYGEDGIDPSRISYLDTPKDLISNYHVAFSKYLLHDVVPKMERNERLFEGRDRTDHWGDDPIETQFSPYAYMGATSERFREKMHHTIANDLNLADCYNLPDDFDTQSASLLKSKYFRSLCDPGESIGILVAQSFGEPATQMTLNTFHLAGTENVTMGIPRLKEIFLNSKLTSKPMIYVPIKMDERGSSGNDAKAVKSYINEIAEKILSTYKSICLSDVIYGVGVDRKLILRESGAKDAQMHSIQVVTRQGEDEQMEGRQNIYTSVPEGDVQATKVMNALQNTQLSFEIQKEWNYEIVIQFENLYHFCQINNHLTVQSILSKAVSCVLYSVLNKIQESLLNYNMRYVHSFNHEHYDELFEFVCAKMQDEFNFSMQKLEYKNDEDKINAKLKFMGSAGAGSTGQMDSTVVRDENHIDEEDAYNNGGIGGPFGRNSNGEDTPRKYGNEEEEDGLSDHMDRNNMGMENDNEDGGESNTDDDGQAEEKNDSNSRSSESGEDGDQDSPSEEDKDYDESERSEGDIEEEEVEAEEVEAEEVEGEEEENVQAEDEEQLEEDDDQVKDSTAFKGRAKRGENSDNESDVSNRDKFLSSVQRMTKNNSLVEGKEPSVGGKGRSPKLKANGSPLSERSTSAERLGEEVYTEESGNQSDGHPGIVNSDGDVLSYRDDENEANPENEEWEKKMAEDFANLPYDYKNNVKLKNDSEEEDNHERMGRENASTEKIKSENKKWVRNIIEKLKCSLLCFVKNISFSPVTWVLKFEIGWDINFFPHAIDFLSYVQAELSKEILFKVKDLNNPKVLKGKDITHSGAEYELQIEGKNIFQLYNIKDTFIDKTKLYCNDIYTIVKTYGIEAGRLCITKELKKVFEAYGIKIDFRHLSFISDFMTHTGDLKSFSRHGLGCFRNVFHKMSFECATNFLTQGCVHNSVDYLSTASSSLFFGKPIKVGTNVADIVTHIEGSE